MNIEIKTQDGKFINEFVEKPDIQLHHVTLIYIEKRVVFYNGVGKIPQYFVHINLVCHTKVTYTFDTEKEAITFKNDFMNPVNKE
jgi:hypothetical protein